MLILASGIIIYTASCYRAPPHPHTLICITIIWSCSGLYHYYDVRKIETQQSFFVILRSFCTACIRPGVPISFREGPGLHHVKRVETRSRRVGRRVKQIKNTTFEMKIFIRIAKIPPLSNNNFNTKNRRCIMMDKLILSYKNNGSNRFFF